MVTQGTQGHTEFRFRKPGAERVFLVGDFLRAEEARLPMQDEGNGEWVCRLPLERGVYQFRFLADGEWHVNQDSGLGWSPFDCNSITVMSETEAAFPLG